MCGGFCGPLGTNQPCSDMNDALEGGSRLDPAPASCRRPPPAAPAASPRSWARPAGLSFPKRRVWFLEQHVSGVGFPQTPPGRRGVRAGVRSRAHRARGGGAPPLACSTARARAAGNRTQSPRRARCSTRPPGGGLPQRAWRSARGRGRANGPRRRVVGQVLRAAQPRPGGRQAPWSCASRFRVPRVRAPA